MRTRLAILYNNNIFELHAGVAKETVFGDRVHLVLHLLRAARL